jgi:hypothetical protein
MKRYWLALMILLLTHSPALAQLDKFLKGLGDLPSIGGGLSDAKIGSGLQEALKVGTENAVTQTSSVDGFLMNKAIKIVHAVPTKGLILKIKPEPDGALAIQQIKGA